MAYRVIVNGIAIEVDSSLEAIELAREAALAPLAPRDNKSANIKPKSSNGALAAEWAAFLGLLNDSQRKALKVIKDNPDGITPKKMARVLGFEKTVAISGTINGGVMKNLTKSGIPEASVIRHQRIEGEMTYFPGPVLLEKELL